MFRALLPLALAVAPTCETTNLALESLIRRTVEERSGVEHCQFRLYDALSDVDGDDAPDLVVVFTVEGAVRNGPGQVQYLAVFGSRAEAAPILQEVGRRGERVITGLEIWPPDIVMTVKEYSPEDAICCPGVPGRIAYRLACGGVQQVLLTRGQRRDDPRLPHPCGHRPVASPAP